MKTTFTNKCSILAEVWQRFRGDSDWESYFEWNDLALAIAYASAEKLVTLSGESESLINEAFDLLVVEVGLEEDTGFKSLNSILEALE